MIERNLEMRRGDLKPDLELDLYDGEVPIDLSAASGVNIVAQQNGVMLFKRGATSFSTGYANMLWQASDTDNPGTIYVEAEIVWAGGKTQTVRMSNEVKVLPDFG